MSAPFSFDETVFKLLGDELGDDYAIEVLQAFLADTADKMANLAVNGHDRELLKREAHSVKGSAATFGFNDLSRLARELERGAQTITAEQLDASVRELRQVFETTKQFAETNLLHAGPAAAT
jgi:HPt (histidine-containing phosphotransfer) domain-containing protein